MSDALCQEVPHHCTADGAPRLCAASTAPPATQLLDLPQPMLVEVLSWSSDKVCVNALLTSCQTFLELRRLPSAAALLLLRCSYFSARSLLPALETLGDHEESRRAVALALLRLLQAGPEAGGPFLASAPVLQGLMHSAAWHGDVAQLRYLLALPQPPDISKTGSKLLLLAIARRSVEGVRVLLERGADPVDGGRGLPFTKAVAAGVPLEILQLLLCHTEPVTLDWARQHATVAAAEQDNCAALSHLLPLSGLAASDLLQNAAARGCQATVRSLAAEGGDVDGALVLACRGGHAACAEMLLEELGADVHHEGEGALHKAVYYGHKEVARMLMRRGAVPPPALLKMVEGRELEGILRQFALQPVPAAAAG